MDNIRNNPFTRAILRWSCALRQSIVPRDLCASCKPLVICLMLLGIMPYRVVGSRLKPIILGTLITIMLCIFVVYANFKNYFDDDDVFYYILYVYLRQSKFSLWCELCIGLLSHFVLLWMLLHCLIRRHCFVGLVDLLSSIDKRLITLNGNVRHGATLWLLFGRMVFTAVFYFVNVEGTRQLTLMQDATYENLKNTNITLTLFLYCMPHTMIGIFLLKWRTVTNWIYHRYQVLNEVSVICY